MSEKGKKRSIAKFDSEFRFLLELDEAMEDWRALAAEYWAGPVRGRTFARTALSNFLVNYLHGQGLFRLRPAELFAIRPLPAPDMALSLAKLTPIGAKDKHDQVSDFLDWVLREKLSEPDVLGRRITPAHLKNPFPRRQAKQHGKTSDLGFNHVLLLDPTLEDWRQLAAEWLIDQVFNLDFRRKALDKFLLLYIYRFNLERNYGRFLLRETPKPDFAEALIEGKTRGSATHSAQDVKLNNVVADFIDWVLKFKLGDEETGGWDRSRFHNPIQRLSKSGLWAPTESNKASLSIRYIKELREMLAEGPNLRDWTWAQQAMEGGNQGGDWFAVDPKIINRDDPDCVWRERDATANEMEVQGYRGRVVELWSPVRAVALYLKLELPLRSFQVRMLDSGEADTWRFIYGPGGGDFVLNRSRLALGSEKRPHQRGVFHHSQNEAGAGLYINTNKTADINKAESEKGYVIPWAHDTALYWLEKLRNWQERYNPIEGPTTWTKLERKHFGGTPPHPVVLAQRGATCFLFRDPTDVVGDKPLIDLSLSRLWYKLLARLEQRYACSEKVRDDGTPLRFVDPNSQTTTYFSLHALRVSLISYLILDLNLPVAVVSKLIAGHARIIMTLYYTKFGKAYMRDVLARAETNELEAEQANHRRFMMDATFEQIGQRFASLTEDAARTVIQCKSAAAFVFEDKGICPVGGTMCDVGGNKIRESSNSSDYTPVPGYPQERNCVRCRFFLTGPAFLPGLQAHFNTVSEKAHRQSERYVRLNSQIQKLESHRHDCERKGDPILQSRELERLSQREEADAEAMSKLVNDMQATYYLIERSIQLASQNSQEDIKLVAKGSISDLKAGFVETHSELHQLEVVCENAVIYPETDASFPTMRRSQILDAMFIYNDIKPLFLSLTPEQQLLSGNAIMKLIQARAGSLTDALPYAECRVKLKNLGVIEEDIWNEIVAVSDSTSVRELMEHAKTNQKLRPILKE